MINGGWINGLTMTEPEYFCHKIKDEEPQTWCTNLMSSNIQLNPSDIVKQTNTPKT